MANNSNDSPSRVPQDPIWCGVGSGKPQPRVKFGGMFGHVVDAFDEKTLPVGQTDYRGKSKDGESKEKVEEPAEEEKAEADTDEADAEVKEEVEVKPYPVSEAVSASLLLPCQVLLICPGVLGKYGFLCVLEYCKCIRVEVVHLC